MHIQIFILLGTVLIYINALNATSLPSGGGSDNLEFGVGMEKREGLILQVVAAHKQPTIPVIKKIYTIFVFYGSGR